MVLRTNVDPRRAGLGWVTALGLAAALVHVGCSSNAESPGNAAPGAAAGASAGGKTAASAAGGAAEGGTRSDITVTAGASGEPTFGAAGESMGGAGELAGGAAGAGAARTFDPQLPPTTGAAELTAWLSAGFYKDWVCEAAPTLKSNGASAIHAHGNLNRVCSNLILAASSASADREFPEGAASVKEVYDQSGRVTAFAVSVKVAARSDGGNGWFWSEGTAAGKGLAGCIGCHSQAGADANHPGAGDFVYFQNTARP